MLSIDDYFNLLRIKSRGTKEGLFTQLCREYLNRSYDFRDISQKDSETVEKSSFILEKIYNKTKDASIKNQTWQADNFAPRIAWADIFYKGK